MTARALLRSATAAEHARVDALFARFDLASAPGYGRFLLAQASAFLVVEAALDEAGAEQWIADWPDRRRSALLLADLAELGIAAPEPLPRPALSGPAAVAGAAYVLEGSRLGGAVLKRSLPVRAPRRFLDAQQAPGSWRKLLETLDHLLYDPARVTAAVEAARGVFEQFEAGGLRYLESKAA